MERNNIQPELKNLLKFPINFKFQKLTTTPSYDKIKIQTEKLKGQSSYKSDFDFEIYKNLEERHSEHHLLSGVIFKNPLEAANTYTIYHQGRCAVEIDTYSIECANKNSHNFPKNEFELNKSGNNEFIFPADISQIWEIFYNVFETDKNSEWRDIIEKRIPLRIGSMEESFLQLDRKYKVTLEFLKILKYYNYPYIISTRSDLVAHDQYMEQMDKKNCSIQMSISSTNDKLNKIIEPNIPTAKRRLRALEKLVQEGFWTTVKLSPLYPIYPNGFFTDPTYNHSIESPKFDFFSFDMIDEIADYKIQSVLTSFAKPSLFELSNISKSTGIDLRSFFSEQKMNKKPSFLYDEKEILFYYEEIKKKCNLNDISFASDISNSKEFFGDDQIKHHYSQCTKKAMTPLTLISNNLN